PCTVLTVAIFSDTIGYPFTRFPNCFMNTQRKSLLLFAVCTTLFLLHHYVHKIATVSLPVMDSYLDPLLFMPILLTLITWERRLFYRNRFYTLSLMHILGYFLLVSVLCEIVFPMWTERMTADVWDVLFYALGTILYIAVAVPHPPEIKGLFSPSDKNTTSPP